LTFYEKCDIIIIEKVKGHNGDKYNEEADKLAVYARDLLK
jgi:ribonuclease HI